MNTEEKYQEILNKFKEDTSKLVDEAISAIYTEYLPYVEDDTRSNVASRSQDVINNLLAGNFEMEGSHVVVNDCNWMTTTVRVTSSQYDNIRKSLIEVMPKCPKDLEIESLKKAIKYLQDDRRNY